MDFTKWHPVGNPPDTLGRYKGVDNRIPPPGDGEVGVRSSGGAKPRLLRVWVGWLLSGLVASQTFTHSAGFEGSVEDAWAILQDAPTWGSIGGVEAVSDAHHGPDGRLLSYSFSATVAGKRYPGRARVITSQPPDHMVVEIDTSELAGTISVWLRPEPTSGAITVELAVRSKGLLSGMMFPLIAGAIGSGLGGNVEAIAARFRPA
jgi:hypothetical protein